ncbi:hypothetical protein D3C83_98580 [compost metagenome]
MQRDARALVLEHQALVACREGTDADGDRAQHVRREAVAVAHALGVAALGAVLAGGGHHERRE